MRMNVSYEIDGWRKDAIWECTVCEAKTRAKHIMNKLHSPYITARKENGEMLFCRYRSRMKAI